MENDNTPAVNLANAAGFLALGAAMTLAAGFLPAHFFASTAAADGSARQLWLALMGAVIGAIGSGGLIRPVLVAGLRALRTAANWPTAETPAPAAVRVGRTGARSAG